MALMGEGRELRLGLSGARPDGACEKTTTHWPTLCVKKEQVGKKKH